MRTRLARCSTEITRDLGDRGVQGKRNIKPTNQASMAMAESKTTAESEPPTSRVVAADLSAD